MNKLIIFDKDGVIVDTEKYSFKAWKDAYKKYGYTLDLETYKAKGIARSRYDFMKFITGSNNSELFEEINEYKNGLYQEYLKDNLRLVRGFRHFFNKVIKHFPVAIGSSGLMKNIKNHMEGVNLITDTYNPFIAIVSGYEVERTKPFPDIFLKTAEKANFSPNNCVVFEDSNSGVVAAKSAGMICYARESQFFSEKELLSAGADNVFKNYSQIDIDKLKNI